MLSACSAGRTGVACGARSPGNMPPRHRKKGQTVKNKVTSEFRKASALLGRHSGFAIPYRAKEDGKRIVEIVEMAEMGPDAGCLKQLFSVLFATRIARMVLGSCSAIAAAYFFQGMAGYRGFEGMGGLDVAAAVLLAAFATSLARLLANRFRREREDLEDVLGHVLAFRDDAHRLSAILGRNPGTARDIVDSHLLDLASKVIEAEDLSSPERLIGRGPGETPSDADAFRRELYSDHALAKKFGLGKSLQGYFDKAKVLRANEARRNAHEASDAPDSESSS